MPLWYRVSYSLGVKDDASAGGGNLNRLLYHGLSHQVAFRLPAGLPHSDNRGRKCYFAVIIVVVIVARDFLFLAIFAFLLQCTAKQFWCWCVFTPGYNCVCDVTVCDVTVS